MIKYNAPELEVITFTAEDIITASGAVAPAKCTEKFAAASGYTYTCDRDAHTDGMHHDPVRGNWTF